MVSAPPPEAQDRPIVIWDDEPLIDQLEALLARMKDVGEMMAQWSELASWLMAELAPQTGILFLSEQTGLTRQAIQKRIDRVAPHLRQQLQDRPPIPA